MKALRVHLYSGETLLQNPYLPRIAFSLPIITTRSFWITDRVEDHMDHYVQEWEQFTAENAKGHLCLEYICLIQSGIVDYAKAPVLYLPYPIVVEMLHRFENGYDQSHYRVTHTL